MKPYPGLRPFETEEQDLFFGRDEECAILVDKILAHRLTLLFAASGAGKTSLLRAAVLPQLVNPERENLTVVVHRDWVDEPIAGLKQAIVAAVEASGRVPAGTFGDDLDSLGLVELCELGVLFVRPPLVLLLDQFEELFRYQRRAATFEKFLEQLGNLVAERSLAVSVALSMREDFALELNALKPFVPGPLFENYFRLERLPVEKARLAIAAPAQKAGFDYEKELLDALLADLADRDEESSPVAELGEGHQTVEPPYLQIVCSELWELEQGGETKVLRLATYVKNGGAAGLSKKYVERILGGLSAREKALASRAFDHLITRRGTKMAYTAGDLAGSIRAPEAALEVTLDRLERAKILRRQSRRGVLWYELHHDLFSRIVDEWNQEFKAKQRRRQVVAGAALVLLSAGVLWVAYDAVVNWTTYYLRLDVRPGVSDVVEVYRGKPGSPDFLGFGGYVLETGITRMDIEPHRNFDVRMLQGLETIELEAAGFLRAGIHVDVPWRAGHAKEPLSLVAAALNTTDSDTAGQVVERAVQFGSLEILELLRGKQSASATPEVIREKLAEFLTRWPLTGVFAKEEGEEASQTEISSESPEGFALLLARVSSRSWVERSAAAIELGFLGRPEALAPLLTLLSDGNSYVRASAVQALGSQGSPEVAARLLPLLSDGDVSMSVAYAMGVLGSSEALVLLLPLLSDSDWVTRGSAARALGSLGNREALAPLLPLLSDSNSTVRGNAAHALGSLGSREALAPLLPLLSDSNSNVRWSVADALGSLGSREALASLLPLLSDSNSTVRWSAAHALGSLGSREALASLLPLLSDSDLSVRWNASEALGSLGSPEVLAPLVPLLSDSNSELRMSATQALGLLGSPEALAPLVPLLSDSDSDVRASAAEALGSLGIPEALAPLVPLLSESKPSVRASAAAAVGSLGSPETLAPLLPLLSDRDSYVPWGAVGALGSLGSPEALAPLVTLLSDSDSDVRGSTAAALGSLGSPESAGPLTAQLTKEPPGNREPFLLALAALHADSARDVIAKIYLEEARRPKFRLPAAVALWALDDACGAAEIRAAAASELYPARIRVAELLGEAKAEVGLPLLEKLLDDPHRRVREAAIVALGKIGSSTSVPRLREIAIKPNPVPASYSQMAAEALGKIGTPEAGAALQEAVQVNEAILGVRAYLYLGDLGATKAVPQLRERLQRLETEHRAWRQLRDLDTTGMKPEEEKAHSQKIAAERNRTAWGFSIAHAIARLDREEGFRLLAHDIASVRKGAAAGLARSGDLALVERLDKARANDKSYPFNVAAFQTIDQTLRFIESTGGAKEREALIELIHKVKDREAVCARIEYTIQMLDRENPIDPKLRVCAPLLPKDLQSAPQP